MPTQCNLEGMHFGSAGDRRKLVGAFDGDTITSNRGDVLLAAADRRLRITERLAGCFIDLRPMPSRSHSVQ